MILSETNHWASLVDHIRIATLGNVQIREPPSCWVKWLQQTTHVMAFSDIASPGSIIRVLHHGCPSTGLWDLDRGLRCFRIHHTDVTSAITRGVLVTPPPQWAAGPAPRCFDIVPTSGMTLRRNTNFVATRCGSCKQQRRKKNQTEVCRPCDGSRVSRSTTHDQGHVWAKRKCTLVLSLLLLKIYGKMRS
ncbi:uncharacterized protein CCOS01_01876 [Colletotrichum costaricense]|uniref:Uncharacterized protein n=1 Tax=Colletotrichum costaricense TaxID=1209916 RepID=A0AAI9Z6V8_9PEZI|nr:uncharacterized protein CCOS01_01876 [Colletotrichum costaricense]KAK1536556.1 hypothetical protein CCOS01_01876 [Colletotrichum costaricense]